jgi:hypothetical protein
MATTMTGEVALPAERIGVGATLDDPKILPEIPRASMPGRPPLEGTGEAFFAAPTKIRIAALDAAFNGRAEACEIAPAPDRRIARISEGVLPIYEVKGRAAGRTAQSCSRLRGGLADGAILAIFALAASQAPAQTRA